MIESEFQIEGYLEHIHSVFDGLNDINYLLHQYYNEEDIFYDGASSDDEYVDEKDPIFIEKRFKIK